MKLKIAFDVFAIQELKQVWVRLRHNSYKFVTHYVTATYNSEQVEYTAKIDMGDPDHV